MALPDTPKPNYQEPPLVEVVIDVCLHTSPPVSYTQIWNVWAEILRREGFTEVSTLPHLRFIPEDLTKPPLKRPAELVVGRSGERFVFENPDSRELVQLQPDRLIFNWRRGNQAHYPQFEHVFGQFERLLTQISDYLFTTYETRILAYRQAELAYVNAIHPASGVWDNHEDIDAVATFFDKKFSDSFLDALSLETSNFHLRFLVPGADGKPFGRLYVDLDSAFDQADRPVLLLKLSLKGNVLEPPPSGVQQFFEQARQTIVRAFTSITSTEMHNNWGRIV